MLRIQSGSTVGFTITPSDYLLLRKEDPLHYPRRATADLATVRRLIGVDSSFGKSRMHVDLSKVLDRKCVGIRPSSLIVTHTFK